MATPAATSRATPRAGGLGRALLLAGRLALGVIFVVAACTKLHFNGGWHFGDYQFFFAMSIDSYKMLPIAAVEWLARILPWFELVLGGVLIAGVGLRWWACAASALLGAFIVAMLRAYLLHLEINCGCFGPNERLGGLTLLRDSSLLVLSLAVAAGAFLIGKREAKV